MKIEINFSKVRSRSLLMIEDVQKWVAPMNKHLFIVGNLFSYLRPFFWFLLLIMLPYLFRKISFSEYLDLMTITIWPFTIILCINIFKKIFTYLFFSLDKFNFFGIQGQLRDIKDVIRDEVDAQAKEIERKGKEEENGREILKLRNNIDELTNEIDNKELSSGEYMNIILENGRLYDKAIDIYEQTISLLKQENMRLNDQLNKLIKY
jgi:hypothetical protein